jgi:hypothetical protein
MSQPREKSIGQLKNIADVYLQQGDNVKKNLLFHRLPMESPARERRGLFANYGHVMVAKKSPSTASGKGGKVIPARRPVEQV